jgi:hypothetical protein
MRIVFISEGFEQDRATIQAAIRTSKSLEKPVELMLVANNKRRITLMGYLSGYTTVNQVIKSENLSL